MYFVFVLVSPVILMTGFVSFILHPCGAWVILLALRSPVVSGEAGNTVEGAVEESQIKTTPTAPMFSFQYPR